MIANRTRTASTHTTSPRAPLATTREDREPVDGLEMASVRTIRTEALEQSEIDERALLVSRARLCAALLFSLSLIFAVLDPLIAPAAAAGLYWLKLAMLGSSAALWLFAHRLSSPRAVHLAITAILLFFQLLVIPSTVLVGIGWHALTVAGALALGAAAIVPWGLAAQLRLTAGLVCLGPIPLFWLGPGDDTVFPVATALLSIGIAAIIAAQHERHHRAMRERMRAVRENVAHLRQLIEHIHGVFWLSELGGSLLYVSPRFEEIWGQSRERLAHASDAWLEPVHREDRAAVAAWAGAHGASDQDSCEYRLIQPNGRSRWIRDGAFRIVDADGRPWRVARFSLDVTGEKEEAQERQMQHLARRAQAAVEEERRRFARDLHDDLGQSLTGIKLMLTSTPQPGVDATRVAQCVAEINRAMVSLRAMIQALRPPLLDELGLVAALRSLAERVAERAGLRCALSLPDESEQFSEEEKTTVFRIAQEALTNVARHADARTLTLRLRADPAGIELAIEDDGRGLDPEREDFGIVGMRERAALVNADLTIGRRPQGGTAVHLRLPRVDESDDRLAVAP